MTLLGFAGSVASTASASRPPTTVEHRGLLIAEGRALSMFVNRNWCEVPSKARVSTVDKKWAVDLVTLGDCRVPNPNYRRVPVLLHRSPNAWHVYHVLFTGTTSQFACEVGGPVARDLHFHSCP
jgi:hypothetical protein